jgi:beta-N-acetylhexosaminidase
VCSVSVTDFVRLPPMKVFGDLYAENSGRSALCRPIQCGWLMASEVLAVGVDISFAPILDVDCGISQVIGDRAFHADPQVAVTLLREFIRGMQRGRHGRDRQAFPGARLGGGGLAHCAAGGRAFVGGNRGA